VTRAPSIRSNRAHTPATHAANSRVRRMNRPANETSQAGKARKIGRIRNSFDCSQTVLTREKPRSVAASRARSTANSSAESKGMSACFRDSSHDRTAAATSRSFLDDDTDAGYAALRVDRRIHGERMFPVAHSSFVRLTTRLQPRRLMMAPGRRRPQTVLADGSRARK
jgi:hypothetical protein